MFRASIVAVGEKCDVSASAAEVPREEDIVSNKNKRGRVMRGGSPKLKFYHFTAPANIPSILEYGIVPMTKERNAHMLPGVDAVWLTSDPKSNTVREAHLELMRKRGEFGELAKYTVGGRRLLFGCNEYGCARITVELREKHVFHYMNLMRANYAVDAPAPLARIPVWGLKTSTPFTFTRSLPSFSLIRSMSGSPKMTKRLPLPVFLRSSAMCKSAFIRALSTGMRPNLLNSVACAS